MSKTPKYQAGAGVLGDGSKYVNYKKGDSSIDFSGTGDKRYVNNVDSKRKAFKARHKCSAAKPGTARQLACTELWKNVCIILNTNVC
mgnify:FL=1|tara:strand:+ start:1329 stop:1589 length:261 start_codon:yes stop_codon:yes gene_type:complete